MRTIIVPTDFSKGSQEAFFYACDIAQIFNANIHVLHVYEREDEYFADSPLKEFTKEEQLQKVQHQLKDFVTKIPVKADSEFMLPHVEVTTQAIEGYVVAKITEVAKEQAAYMIIMGTTGSHNTLEKTIGNISTSVAQRAHCPVLLIPKDVAYRNFDNILYASDYDSSEESIIKKSIDFANIFRATMHFVHVSNKTDKNYERVEDTIYKVLFKDGEPGFAFNILTVDKADVTKGLNDYASTHYIDLIVLVNKHKSLLENTMGKSITQKMGLYTKIPMMVYH